MLDESKLDQVHSYREVSVLKEEFLPGLEFQKTRVLFHWLINAHLDNDAAYYYTEQVAELRGLSKRQLQNGEAEAIFCQRDVKMDEEMRRRNLSHYVSKKYINILWGSEYGYDLS